VAGLELRPRSVTELVDAALQLLRGHYPVYVMLLAVISLPSIIFSQVMFDAMRTAAPGRVAWGPTLLVFAAGTLFGAIAQGTTAAAMSSVYLHGRLDLRWALQRAASRLGALLVAVVARYAAMFAGFVLLFVPGLFVALRTACLDCSVLLDDEDDDGFAAFGRTWRLTHDLETHILLSLLLAFAIYGAGYAVVVLIVRGLAGFVPALQGQRLATLAEGALTLFILPVMPAVRTALYYDLRVRQQGLDVEQMVHSLDASPAPSTPR
jgi:hypothetical protein